MLRIGMCDDDLEGVKLTSKFLDAEIINQNLDAEITIISDNQKEIFDAIYKKEIDILFLDVDFKTNGKNGIDFAKDLREVNKDFYLIFLTAHQRYMHVSFIVKVFDYLVKPINKNILEDLVSRIKEEFTYDKKIFLHLNKWESVRTNDILYIEKCGNKSIIVTRSEKYSTLKTLDTLLNELPIFFRKCHRSYIVNENKILRLDKKSGYVYFTKDIFCPVNSQFSI